MRALLAILLLLAPGVARAQPLFGTTAPTGSGSVVTPTGATGSASLGDIAAQQGVLLDAFRVAADTDDTASMTRAVASGVPILLGPKTYTINNFATGAVAAFVLSGVQGKSTIQRTSASNSAFFQISAANVAIDGVTFDANSGSVSANQWGVLLNAGGQTVSVKNSVFKNNSGTLGSCFALNSSGPASGGSFNFSDNEVTNCSSNAATFGSVSKGVISRNYVHDVGGLGINVSSSSTPSATNYAAGVVVDSNTVVRSASTCIAVGGLSSPFTFGTPAAVQINVSNNTLQDCTTYAVSLEGDFLSAIGNHIDQSAPNVVVLGAIDTLARYSKVQNNVVNLQNVNFAIDIGGSIEMLISGNTVSMNQGSAYNTGGNQNSLVTGNVANLSGTAYGVTNFNIEGTGSGGIFPTVSSGTIIENNIIKTSATTTIGIQMFDNAGAGLGAQANVVRGNKFFGGNTAQAILYKGTSHSISIGGNFFNGSQFTFADPNGSGDLIFDPVFFGGDISGASGSVDIRAIEMRDTATYNAGGSVLWITPTAVGSGYTAATVINISGTGCTGQVATPQINSGQIIGVKVSTFGTGCSGTVTATATDSGGGTGATFSVGTVPQMPDRATLGYLSNSTRVLKSGGGAVAIRPNFPLQLVSTDSPVALQAIFGGTLWQLAGYTMPTIAFGSLPTCDATHSGAQVLVSGSVSGKWQARCNGTNWIAPDGTTIN